MLLRALINECRSDVDDLVEDYLWTDDDWTAYFNDAVNEACSRAHLLIDGTTASICQVPIVAGTGLYTLDSRVLAVKRVKLSDQTIPLTQSTWETLDATVLDWENLTGDPKVFVNESKTELLLVPKPAVSDTAYLRVARLPLVVMTDPDNHSPEIPEEYHRGLMLWAISRAYLKNDEDTLNLRKSQMYEAKFTAKFGPSVSAKAEKMRQRTPRDARVRWRGFGF
jgi:hypothetical protein